MLNVDKLKELTGSDTIITSKINETNYSSLYPKYYDGYPTGHNTSMYPISLEQIIKKQYYVLTGRKDEIKKQFIKELEESIKYYSINNIDTTNDTDTEIIKIEI